MTGHVFVAHSRCQQQICGIRGEYCLSFWGLLTKIGSKLQAIFLLIACEMSTALLTSTQTPVFSPWIFLSELYLSDDGTDGDWCIIRPVYFQFLSIQDRRAVGTVSRDG